MLVKTDQIQFNSMYMIVFLKKKKIYGVFMKSLKRRQKNDEFWLVKKMSFHSKVKWFLSFIGIIQLYMDLAYHDIIINTLVHHWNITY